MSAVIPRGSASQCRPHVAHTLTVIVGHRSHASALPGRMGEVLIALYVALLLCPGFATYCKQANGCICDWYPTACTSSTYMYVLHLIATPASWLINDGCQFAKRPVIRGWNVDQRLVQPVVPVVYHLCVTSNLRLGLLGL